MRIMVTSEDYRKDTSEKTRVNLCIRKDQKEWLDENYINKSKLVRDLLDDYIERAG